MLLSTILLIPFLATLLIFVFYTNKASTFLGKYKSKPMALIMTVIVLLISLIIWFLFDNSSKHFQFIQQEYNVAHYDFYLGLDGLSIYFILLTTLIIPISIISNWKSINEKTAYFIVIILVLESALLLIYSVLDILMFYVFFESILAPLFILIGFFGSSDKLRASFYFFLYTFLGSLFMLLSIITVSSLTGCTDMDLIFFTNYAYLTQVFLFLGIFVAFAVKTPVIFLNSWLLKAHVESPLSGSVILAAIVLKLSLYGVFRLILPLVPKAFIFYTHVIFVICIITILYASFSTIRTIDVKELIAYSSVSHAAVYFAGILSNVKQGIQGGILLGLAHGFVSSGLFISGGGVLYDRSSTRTINYYGGLAQVMPIFSIVFFILCLGNCGAPLTLNFVGEFMSLYGIFERLPLAGILASSSIILSAVYTIFMFNRIILGGKVKGWYNYLSDLNKREYSMLLVLAIFTIILGVYPSILLDSLHYVVSSLLFNLDFSFNETTKNPEYLLIFLFGFSAFIGFVLVIFGATPKKPNLLLASLDIPLRPFFLFMTPVMMALAIHSYIYQTVQVNPLPDGIPSIWSMNLNEMSEYISSLFGGVEQLGNLVVETNENQLLMAHYRPLVHLLERIIPAVRQRLTVGVNNQGWDYQTALRLDHELDELVFIVQNLIQDIETELSE